MIKRQTVFAADKPSKHRFLSSFLMLLFILAALLAVNFINNGRIKVDRVSVTITSLPKELESFRILHISDLHGNEFGASQSTIKTMLNTQRFNAVCITGDVCSPDGDYSSFIKLIDSFTVPVYFISGDEDPDPYLSSSHETDTVKSPYILTAEQHGAIYLDHPEKIQAGATAVWFVPENLFGLDIDQARTAYKLQWNRLVTENPVLNADTEAELHVIAYQLELLDEIQESMSSMKNEDVKVALSHYPLSNETIVTLQQWSGTAQDLFFRDTDLVLSGHYCGGQIRIPFVGPIKSPSSLGGRWLPGDQGITGLSTIQGITQYISPGLGISSVYQIPVRIFNTPTVTVLSLTSMLNP